MPSKMLVRLKTRVRDRVILQVHPQMTSRQLSQLICASSLLHGFSTDEHSSCTPIGLISQHHNLFVDYLLASETISLSKISCFLQMVTQKENGQNEEEINLDDSFCRPPPSKKDTLQLSLQVVYQHHDHKQNHSRLLLRYTELNNQKKSFTNNSTESLFETQIELKVTTSGFLEKRMFKKALIQSYEDIQNLMTIRQRLTQLACHHIDLFGPLEETHMEQNHFVLSFQYEPSVSVKDLLETGLNESQIQVIKYKIVSFLTIFQENGFGQLLSNYIKDKKIDLLLDQLRYTITGRIQINRLELLIGQTLILSKEKISQENIYKLVQEYIYARSSNACQQSLQIADRQSLNQKQIDLFDFFIIFNRQKYQLSAGKPDKYSPLTSFFIWNKHQTSHSLKRQVWERTTTKKKKQQRVNMSFSKTKKDKENDKVGKRKTKTKAKLRTKKGNLSMFI